MGTMTRPTRLARCGLITAMVLAAGVVSASPARAASLDAADFAADCTDDGVVIVSGRQRYVGGTGTISAYCRVDLTSDATLVFRDVELTGTSLVSGLNTVENTTIKVIDSVIEMFDPEATLGGVLELSTGGEADEPGANGRVVILGSTLSAGALLVSSSFDWPDGSVVVRDSTLASTVADITVTTSHVAGSDGSAKIIRSELISAEDIEIATGLADYVGPGGGQNGVTKVASSSLQAASGEILIASGQGGRTKVRNAVLSAPTVRVTTGVGGSCQTSGNTPVTACT